MVAECQQNQRAEEVDRCLAWACCSLCCVFLLLLVIKPTVTAHVQQHLLRWLARRTVTALHGTTLHWWLDFGSLLGLMCQGDVILGDNDVDICVLDEPHTKAELQRLKTTLDALPSSTVTLHLWPTISRVTILGSSSTSRDGAMIHGATGPNSDIPVDLVGTTFALRWWDGPRVWVWTPEQPLGVLRWRYGNDWVIPRPGSQGRDPRTVRLIPMLCVRPTVKLGVPGCLQGSQCRQPP